MKKRKISTDELLGLKFIRSLVLSPDEGRVAFTVEVAADDKKKYFSHIFMVDTEGGKPRQYTFGEVSDANPVFSPDGLWLIFSSKRGEKKGLYKMSTSGGEAKILIESDGSFSDISVSPNGRQILCVFKKADEVPKDKDGKKEEPVFRHITRKAYKLDNSGYLPEDRGHVHLIDIETGHMKRVVKTRNGEKCPVWFPDGKKIAYITNLHPDPDEESLRDDIFVLTLGGKPRRLDKPAGPVEGLSVSPDGREIAYLGHSEPDDAWGVANFHIWKISASGGKPFDLTPKLEFETTDMVGSDTAEETEFFRPAWSKDGREIFFLISGTGSSYLACVRAAGGKIKPVLDGKLHVMGAVMRPEGKVIAAAISYPTRPAEIFVMANNGAGKPRQLTRLNSEMVAKTIIGRPEEIIVPSVDGYPVHGWILKPPDFSPKKKYPSILEIHGGPRLQYGNTFFHEMQYLAAKGYVVYYGNPRGSQGYGRAHAGANVNAWGTIDYEDCMALANFMASQGYIDPRRMGVTGGSYGGYMTNWIVSHTDMFAAAVTQRSVTNFISFYGSSDFGYALDREIKGKPWSDIENWWEMSPIKHVANIKTPLLIIHSESDLRCAIEQAEQLFVSLKKLGRTVEMVRFPEEAHGLSRCGRPDRRVARLEWIAKWFDRYLKGIKK